LLENETLQNPDNIKASKSTFGFRNSMTIDKRDTEASLVKS